MKITFANNDVLGLCTNDKLARKKLGEAGFKRLRTRLADIEAARCVTELPAGKPHPLLGDRLGQYAVSLDGGRRLMFEPDAKPPPRRCDGSIAWESVTAIRIVEIGDYHD